MGIRLHGLTLRSLMDRLKNQINNNIVMQGGSGAPTDGTSGTGAGTWAGVGCQYADVDTGYLWVNEGTLASPAWGFSGTQVST